MGLDSEKLKQIDVGHGESKIQPQVVEQKIGRLFLKGYGFYFEILVEDLGILESRPRHNTSGSGL